MQTSANICINSSNLFQSNWHSDAKTALDTRNLQDMKPFLEKFSKYFLWFLFTFHCQTTKSDYCPQEDTLELEHIWRKRKEQGVKMIVSDIKLHLGCPKSCNKFQQPHRALKSPGTLNIDGHSHDCHCGPNLDNFFRVTHNSLPPPTKRAHER